MSNSSVIHQLTEVMLMSRNESWPEDEVIGPLSVNRNKILKPGTEYVNKSLSKNNQLNMSVGMNGSDVELDHGEGWMLGTVDLVVVVVYFVGSLGLGLWYGRKHRSDPVDYFLAGRSSSWQLVASSIYASNISSTQLVGMAGSAYTQGIAVYMYEWMASPVLVVMAYVVLPGLIRSQVFTLPELLQLMYCPAARYYFSAINIVINIVMQTAGSLYAGALLLQVLLPNWALWHIMLALGSLAAFYTVLGGLTAVMVTDAVQAVLLLVGSIIMTVAAVMKAGGWNAVVAAQPPGHFSMIRPLGEPSVPWLGLPGVFLLGVYFFAINQFMAQRMLSVRCVEHGQWAAMLTAVLKLLGLFIIVVPGLAARILYPNLSHGDLVYPTLMFDLLPTGLRGLVLSGFLAALMSMLDSTMNGCATLFTMDFIRPAFPNMTQGTLLKVGQVTTVVVMVGAVAWAPQIRHFPMLFQYLQQVLAYTVAPVLALYIVGFFWQGGTPTAAMVTIAIGTIAGLAFFLAIEVFQVLNFHFLYVPSILLVLSIMILVIGSLLDPRHKKVDHLQKRPALWSLKEFREETKALKKKPLWQNYRLQSVVVLILTFAILIAFW
ncbi:hypothetical protein Pcinc_015281 [Petrolisthes cinctipes]|uniref:Sodium/solute symporter n=1 Tax=Petrolisthes cinctipes TaxID=88211 RepID=A0AAE1FTD9_PETCI|nr:hypothetical protein Pcinc_015281 [Petrolisthes cinctipes]